MKTLRFAEGDIARIERPGQNYGRVGIVKQAVPPERSGLGWDYVLVLDEGRKTYGFLDEELDLF